MNDYGSALHPLLACGHIWDDIELWNDIAVILKEMIDSPDGPLPAYSTKHFYRRCRATLVGERLGSAAEADTRLKRAQAPTLACEGGKDARTANPR